MECAELFETNLQLIDRAIGSVCRRAGVWGADAEDFASTVKLALIENDYAVLRGFEGRSSLFSFLIIIVQRLLHDEWTRRHGRWHPSREAERRGEAAIVLEQLLRRDHRSIDEALPIVRNVDPSITREQLVELDRLLPARPPRPRLVELEDAEARVSTTDTADARAIKHDLERLSDRAGRVIRNAIDAMPLEDRSILRFHFGSAMKVADISRMLRLPQRPLYRRIEALLRALRAALVGDGISAHDAADLIGSGTLQIDFGLRDRKNSSAWRTATKDVSRTVEEGG